MKFKVLILFVITIFITFNSCKDSTGQDADGTGVLQISLTDAAADFQEVNISFSQISAHIDSQWVTVNDTSQTINLLEWSNGRSLVIGSAEVPSGRYNQIRLLIDSASVVLDNQKYPLTVPSGAQTGLKLNVNFDIEEGITYHLTVDFDASRSVLRTGGQGNPAYKLKPTLRVIPTATTGAISGIVTNFSKRPIAYAISGSDTITSSIADVLTGEFTLAFLPEAVYEVSVSDTAGLKYSAENVTVTSGNINDIGSIILQ